MKNLIVVDIDSTLYSFSHAFAHVARRDHQIECTVDPQEWTSIIQDFVDPADAIKLFPVAYAHDMIDFNEPYQGAVQSLQHLVDQEFRLAYYTDRPAEATEATHTWLTHYNFPEGEIHVCADKRSEILARRDEVVTIVDDRPRTLVWGRFELGLDHVHSLRHGYNRALSDVPGIHIHNDWASMAQAIVTTSSDLVRPCPSTLNHVDEQAAYSELVQLLSSGPREHNYGMLQSEEGAWCVAHLPNCWACAADSLLERLGEL